MIAPNSLKIIINKGKKKEKLHARRILCKHTVFLSYID